MQGNRNAAVGCALKRATRYTTEFSHSLSLQPTRYARRVLRYLALVPCLLARQGGMTYHAGGPRSDDQTISV